ncbi:MAG: SDR family NAD(P)-dependent oxidoreductase [Geminicoccaceae bacterium]
MDLSGKVALVTGAGRGIGKGIAMALAKAGADIALADIREENARAVADEIQGLGRRTSAMATDVTDWDQVQAMVERTIRDLGRLDIAVNNAGVISIKSVADLTPDDWDFVNNVNAKGVFMCCKAELAPMKAQKWGRIINVASIAGKQGFPDLAHYSASKFAVVGFTNALAKEVARDGITVNAICPGIVGTAMWVGGAGLSAKWKQEGETEEQSWARHQDVLLPQGVAQTPEDMGQLAVYLVEAAHVTGQSINVDGGFTHH